MKNVIVTGANGFVGSSLIKRLLAENVHVVAVDIRFAPDVFPETDLLTKIEAYVDSDLADWIPSGRYDAFYHFAWRGVNGSEKSDPYVQLVNIRMAVTCADVCHRLNIPKLLCAGTVAENAVQSLSHLVSTNGGMVYGVAKHTCRLMLETYCKHVGVSCVWMQFSNIYGVGNATGNLVSYTLEALLSDKEATFGPAQQPYDFIYVDDLIEAVYRLGFYEARETSYFIGSGRPQRLCEYLQTIGEIAGRPNNIKIGVRDDDGIKYDFSMFDTAALRRDIGNYVTVSFEDGIRKTIDWLKLKNE